MVTSAPLDTPGWTVVGGFYDGRPVRGLPADLWALRWEDTGESIDVTDPLHGNHRVLPVWEIATDDGPATFAAGEVSNGVWLVALPGIL